ncbi:Uncharacterized protein DAT39_022034, partial [Clarias magur]
YNHNTRITTLRTETPPSCLRELVPLITEPISTNKKEITIQAQVHHREVSPVTFKDSTDKIMKNKSVMDGFSLNTGLGSEEGETCSDEATSGRRGIRMIGNIKEKSLSNTRSESDSLESYMALKPEWSSPDSSGGDIIDREQQNLNALNDYIDECGYPLLELNKLLFQ